MYKFSAHPRADKELSHLDKQVRAKAKKFIDDLLENPYTAEALKGDLKGYYSFHFQHLGVHYRIIFKIEDGTFRLLYVMTRENAYDIVRRSMRG